MRGVLRQTVTRGGQTIAEAEIERASVDAGGKPTPWPPAFDLSERGSRPR
jgi:acyl-CoA thioesterase FadM